MKNDTPTNQERRFKAYVSLLGTTQLHLRSPYMIAFWSAIFPGFGHLLLSKYIRGYILVLWAFFINFMSQLNLALIYSFTGHIEMAKVVLEPRWWLLFVPVYLFAIWDSYRTTVDLNKLYVLAERENAKFTSYNMGAAEINYLDKRTPWMAVIWSIFMPGLGQLYIHRIMSGFLTLLWIITSVYFSGVLVAVQNLFLGDVHQATQALDRQWLLFIPPLYGFSIYDAYVNTVENNKLYESEQRSFLTKNYQKYRVRIPVNMR